MCIFLKKNALQNPCLVAWSVAHNENLTGVLSFHSHQTSFLDQDITKLRSVNTGTSFHIMVNFEVFQKEMKMSLWLFGIGDQVWLFILPAGGIGGRHKEAWHGKIQTLLAAIANLLVVLNWDEKVPPVWGQKAPGKFWDLFHGSGKNFGSGCVKMTTPGVPPPRGS